MATVGRREVVAIGCVIAIVSGCSELHSGGPVDPAALERRARTLLIDYSGHESPLLRSHAIEALASSNQTAAVSFVLAGLEDTYWGVRFSACMAVLEMRYEPADALLLERLKDPNRSVRAAAAGALHVLGDRRHTGILGRTLFDDNVLVRRNTAMVLGRLGERSVVKLLKGALRDDDLSVRLQVTEAMAILGNKRAQRFMLSYCQSAYDDEAVLGMLALAEAKVSEAIDQIAYVYERSDDRSRLGMRLVAARALAALGDDRGREAALTALRYRRGPADESARIRKLAALALARMSDPANLGHLQGRLDDSDPDVQIAAALAILKSLAQ